MGACRPRLSSFAFHFQVIFLLVLLQFCKMQDHQGAKWVRTSELYYGGIMKDFLQVPANDSDITFAAKFAVEYALKRIPVSLPRDEEGNVLPWGILDAKKSKLQYTKDGSNLHIHEEILDGPNGPQLQKRKAVLGIIYTFTLAWPSKPGSLRHVFSVSKDREKRLFVYSHYCHHPGVEMPSDYQERHRLPGNIGRGGDGRVLDASMERTVPLQSSTDCLECHSQEFMGQSGKCSPSDSRLVDQSESKSASPGLPTAECESQGSSMWTKGKGGTEEATEGQCDLGSCINMIGRFSTYNIWNFNSQQEPTDKHYAQRMAHMGKLLSESRSDFIGIQEGRYDQRFRTEPGPSQVSQLAAYLPTYQFVYQPAQLHWHDSLERVEEGLILFSKHNILTHDFILLPRNTTEPLDYDHQRICLHAEVEHPTLGIVHVYVAHLSLVAESRERSVVEIWRFMQRHPGLAVILGDFNAEPHETSMRFLRGEIELQGHKTEGLVDAWTVFHNEPRPDAPETYRDDEPRDHGLNFSTLEEHLRKRIDYVYVRLTPDTKLLDVSLIDDGLRGDDAASDHVGVSAVIAPASQT